MRNVKAKRLRARARLLAAHVRTTVSPPGGSFVYLTGYRRIYQDLKHHRSVTT